MRRFIYICLLVLLLLAQGCDKPRRPANRSATAPAATGANVSTGKPFVPFSLPTEGEGRVSLADFSGKLLMINFWATWCAPCVAEMPALERLYQTYRGRGLEILAITVDPVDAQGEVKDFVKRSGLSFQIAYDPDLKLPPKLGITGFPETFFVGPDGKMISFLDPETKKSSVRIISDRAWDSQTFIQAIGALLDKHLPNDTDNS